MQHLRGGLAPPCLNPTYYAAPQVQLADRHPVSKICITFCISQYSDATTEAHQKDRLLLLSIWTEPILAGLPDKEIKLLGITFVLPV